MKLGYIYKTTDLLNKKLYIGKKKGEFDPRYFGSGLIIKRALNKRGKDNFKVELIVYSDNEDKLNKLEKFYIAEYRRLFGRNCLYNIGDGGEGYNCSGKYHHRFGTHPTEETRKKKSISMLRLNFKHSLRTRRLMSKHQPDHSGSNNPMYGKGLYMWITNLTSKKTKYIKKELLKNYLLDGWSVGRLIYHRKTNV